MGSPQCSIQDSLDSPAQRSTWQPPLKFTVELVALVAIEARGKMMLDGWQEWCVECKCVAPKGLELLLAKQGSCHPLPPPTPFRKTLPSSKVQQPPNRWMIAMNLQLQHCIHAPSCQAVAWTDHNRGHNLCIISFTPVVLRIALIIH